MGKVWNHSAQPGRPGVRTGKRRQIFDLGAMLHPSSRAGTSAKTRFCKVWGCSVPHLKALSKVFVVKARRNRAKNWTVNCGETYVAPFPEVIATNAGQHGVVVLRRTCVLPSVICRSWVLHYRYLTIAVLQLHSHPLQLPRPHRRGETISEGTVQTNTAKRGFLTRGSPRFLNRGLDGHGSSSLLTISYTVHHAGEHGSWGWARNVNGSSNLQSFRRRRLEQSTHLVLYTTLHEHGSWGLVCI